MIRLSFLSFRLLKVARGSHPCAKFRILTERNSWKMITCLLGDVFWRLVELAINGENFHF